MADGEPKGAKHGDSSPKGHKRSPSKQTPTSAMKEYYCSEVPGINNRKNRPGNRSPSADRAEQTRTPELTPPSRQCSPTYAQQAAKSPSQRPSTPTDQTTQMEERTPRAQRIISQMSHHDDDDDMEPDTNDIDNLASLEKDMDMDYPRIYEGLQQTLEDIESIVDTHNMETFHISQWLSKLSETLGVKIISELEWESINPNLMYETTESDLQKWSKQPESHIAPTQHMDNGETELKKVREELATVQDTIKNLTNAVMQIAQPNQTGPTQTNREPHHTQTPQAPHTSEPSETPRWVKSANPTVIKPTRNTTSKSQQAASTTKPRADPHRLILQFNPTIAESDRKNADTARKEINTLLDSLGAPSYFRAMAVNWSRNGNPIITTTAGGLAEDLLEHANEIAKIFTKNNLISALPDTEYYHAKVNMLSTKDAEGYIRSGKAIHQELMDYVLGYDKLRHACLPRWLGNAEYLEAKSHSSMVFSFTTAEDRDKFLGYGPVWVFNKRCTITHYEERPQVFACRQCGSFAHKQCEAPACLKCNSKDHTTDSHPADAPLYCVNCRKEHAATYVNCNHRRRLLGLNPLPEATDKAPPKKKAPRPSTNKQTRNQTTTTSTNKDIQNIKVIGLDGSQLLDAINSEDSETPLNMRISSAIHEKAQSQVNRSSQRLREKEAAKIRSQSNNRNTGMEGIELTPSNN